MEPIYLTLVLLALLSFIILYYFGEKDEKNGRKSPPWVSGRLPIIGHALQLNGNMVPYLRSCYDKYGRIFKIQLFRYKLLMICDTKYASEYFKAPEDELGMYEYLYKLNFLQSYSEKHNALENIADIMRSTVAKRFEQFFPILEEESTRLGDRLSSQLKSGQQPNLMHELHRYVALAGARCFLGVPLTDDTLRKLIHLTDVVNRVFVTTFIFPLWLTKFLFKTKVDRMKAEIGAEFALEIVKYREDPAKRECEFLRESVDLVDKYCGEKLSNEEISSMIILLFISNFESTETLLNNVVLDLATHPEHFARATVEVDAAIATGDVKAILASKYIHGCVMEAARLSQLVFGLGRSPLKGTTLGEYHIADIDMLIMVAPLIQVYGCAAETFANPTSFNPDRYRAGPGKVKEPSSPFNITSWGAGTHLCPGMPFAFFEIKLALAHVLKTVQIQAKPGAKMDMDYWKFNLFAEKKVDHVMTHRKVVDST